MMMVMMMMMMMMMLFNSNLFTRDGEGQKREEKRRKNWFQRWSTERLNSWKQENRTKRETTQHTVEASSSSCRHWIGSTCSEIRHIQSSSTTDRTR
jgi:hypothetical protein